MQRYFSNKLIDNYFDLKEDDLYHIKTVMRMKNNDLIEIVYESKLFLAKLEITSSDIKVLKQQEEVTTKNTKPYLTLIVPVLKDDKFSFIIEKATELGIDKIIPVITERTIVKYDDKKKKERLIRWNKIVKEASEQSKRLSIPVIDNITNIINLNDITGLKILCSTVEKENTLSMVLNNNKIEELTFIVGPEGGFSPKEEELLIQNGFISTTLTKTILRVETAPIYVLSNINYHYNI